MQLDSKLARQFGKFALVGAGNTLVTAIAYFLLRVAGLPAPESASLAFIAGGANGYWWNRRWTFENRAGRGSLLRYAVVQIVGAGATEVLVSVGIDAGIGEIAAFASTMALVTTATFAANRCWSFAERGERPADVRLQPIT